MVDQLSWFQALVLGISQGLTEFLPVSSSAHTLIVSRLFGWPDPGAAFTAVTQLGTESAVIWYFRHEIRQITSAWFRGLSNKEIRQTQHSRMGWFVIIGTVPIATLGVIFQSHIETTARNLWLVAIALIVMGIVLGFVDHRALSHRDEGSLNFYRALFFGFGQALALIPGVSRSGATITFGRAMGFSRESATRYSFLLAIPAVLSSALFEATKISQDVFVNWPATIVATLVAAVVGYVVIATLMNYLKTKTFLPFVIYRVALGTILFGLLVSGSITAT